MISFLFSLSLLLDVHIIGTSSAFLLTSPYANQIIQCRHNRFGISSTAIQSAADGTNESEDSTDDDGKEDGVGFTALPAIGASSFWDRDGNNSLANNDAYKSSDLARPDSKNLNKNRITINNEHASIVSNKFKIQYTCKKCDTRNSHSVTRMAYRKGIVIAMCKGCHSKHLLADNLGWSNYVGGFDFDGGEYNIEMYMKNKANEEARKNGGLVEENSDLVMRVNQDVFDLESVLYKGQKDEKNMYAKGKRGEDDDNVGEDVASWH